MSICYDVRIHFVGCVWENNEPKERQKAMNRKIWKALGIAVCMLALAAPRAMAVSRRVGSDAEFKDAVEAINQSGDNENEIFLTQDITLKGNTTDYTLTNGKETTTKTTTIKGEGNTITVNPGAGITVAKKGTVLNLGANGYDGTLTIDGKTSGGFVSVLEGATANMYENVTLQNWQFVGNACVVIMGSDPVTGSKSVFNMYGGVIEKCSRAVMADSGTTFHMLGGKILNCVSGNDGGGIFLYKATFIMDGGIISGCEGLLGGGLYAEKSSTVNINNGTISGCTAGAGGGLYVVGSTLNIKGGTISECFVSDTGKGGGLFADQSTLTISGGTIKGNKAAYGGGVALRDSRVKEEEPITNWTVVDNKAYKTKTGTGYVGGGIYLENGSMNASAGSNKIYNNTADGHGADICLDGSSTITLPIAANMGAKYHDSGIKIDNWYKDDNPRYTPSENGEVVGAGVELKGGLSLVASYKASPVRIEIDANGGVGGSSSQTVQKGTNVTLEAPTKEGHLFKGWKDEKGNSYPAGEDGKVNITATGDMTLTAEWKKLPSAENLPKTGDESPVLLWGAVLAVSAAACFMLRRKK